ncbi:MAG: pilus assembly protein [Luteimonas sp.]
MALNQNKSRRLKLTLAGSLTALAATGYFLYSVFAVQGQGVLAQAPLNSQVQVPASFIMALDDSGSMRFQTLFPSRDGGALWGGTGNNASFFYASGTEAGSLRVSDSSRQFVHVAPYPAPRQANATNDNAAIPPIDAFGFSRSHVYNRAYFDPDTPYQPWKDHLGVSWPDATPTAVRVDPNTTTPVLDLTVERRNTSSSNATHHAFRVRSGMVLPEGMEFNGTPGCGLNNPNSKSGSASGWRELTRDVTASCNVNAHIAYFPATFYLPVDYPAPDGFREDRRVLAPNACTYSWASGSDRCDMYRYEIRPGNYSSTAAYDAAIQNFANWFSYYGARNRSMVAAVTNSLATVNNMSVGYFTINNRVAVNMRDMARTTERKLFYDSIVTLGASGNTPNLQAVDWLGQQFQRTNSGAPVQLACQRNAGMLFTDGFSNVAGPSVGNVDGNMGAPFQDGHSNTLADIATKYYRDATDGGVAPLRSGSDFPSGRVPVPDGCNSENPDPRLNCQSNLHMNFYGITLGARGREFDPENEQDPFEEPYISWPKFESNQRSTIDDIWHATVNTRGDFINATTPAEITAAMRRILATVTGGQSPSGTIALTGARVGTGSLSVVPSYEVDSNGTDWSGELIASQAKADPGGQVVSLTEAWTASERLPAAASRNIRFGAGNQSHPFNPTYITDFEMLCDTPLSGMSLCHPDEFGPPPARLNVTVEQAVAYLRGDISQEVRSGGKLRDRKTPIGSIVNSTPVVSAPRDDYGYGSLSGFVAAADYGEYLQYKRDNNNTMVYVGANDGMLHAFDGGMGHDGVMTSTGGRERFGFIPQSVLGYMGNLLFPYVEADAGDQKFQHRYFVDGPIAVSDAYYDSSWSTVLVGTTGAGGRSVFALDVAAASRTSTPSFSDSDYLWEINSLNDSLPSAVRANMGNVLGRPVIVPVRSGGSVSWKAIFGNGYNSDSGKAVLFIVDIDDGPPSIRMIEANEHDAPAGTNGLGNIVVLDRYSGADQDAPGRDGFADTVYAADQKGAVWRFHLGDDADEVTTPLFVTQAASGDLDYRQPITGGLTAAAGPAGGVMLYFGTGSFSFVHDPADESIQSLYGILDSGLPGTMTVDGLLEQTITSTDADDGIRKVSANVISGQRGWYLDLPAGERFVGYPRLESGIIFMPTYAPSEMDGCSTQGFNWLFGLNALSGSASLSQVSVGSPTGDSPGEGTGAAALDTGGTAPVRDVAVMTAPRIGTLAAGSDPDDLEDALATQCSMVVQVAGAPPLYLPRACGRQSWRQLL